MKYTVGMKVRITEDCRDFEETGISREICSKTGHIGTYVGDIDFSNIGFPTPKIMFDDGDVIYGIECWWEVVEDDMPPLEESQILVDAYKQVLRDTLLNNSGEGL